MKAKEFEFDRNFLKHTNYKNGCHVYTGMETESGAELPESVIKLLYRIYVETAEKPEEMDEAYFV